MSITEMLGIQYPIFSGAMMRIATHELVGAVSEAGDSVFRFSGVICRTVASRDPSNPQADG